MRIKQKEYYHVEKPLMEQLCSLGWDTIISEPTDNEWRDNPSHTLRNSFDEVVIKSRLSDSLIKLNPWLEPDQVQNLVDKIANFTGSLNSSGLMTKNEEFFNYLIEQPIIDENRKTGEKNPNVKIIEFDPDKLFDNNFLAINQFKVPDNNSTQNNMVPDIVLFINGIPFVVIECKYTHNYGSDSIEKGIDQLKYYANNRPEIITPEGNEKLFYYNAFVIATDLDEAVVGTISSEADQFMQWIEPYPLPENMENFNSQQKMVLGTLSPSKIIDIIQNYILFLDTGVQRIKIMPRYHQFRAVSKIIDRLINKESPEKRSGVVWHTQGSGKSLSMVFLIKKIRSNDDLKDYKIVAINDRTDLASQLGQTLHNAEKVYEIENYTSLEDEIKTSSSNLLNVLAHKFLKRDNENDIKFNYDLDILKLDDEGQKQSKINKKDLLKKEKYLDELNKSDRILIIVDEAHRTQSGIFGDNIRKAMPNATLIGFTGTPLIGDSKDKSTMIRFGKYIDKYSMEDSIKEGFTLPILYTGKTSQDKILSPEKLNQEFYDMFSNKSHEERAIILSKYANIKTYIESEVRINAISKDIVKYYMENIFDNGTKAQIVAYTRLAAIRYKKAIDEEIKKYISNYENEENIDNKRLELMKILSSCAYISYNAKETELALIAMQADDQLGEKQKNFKASMNVDKPETGLAFLIVQNRLLTGFDAPIEQVMFIDRSMKNHTLLQAIARVNRVYPNKKKGIIVDYIGFTNHLSDAIDLYIKNNLPSESILENIENEIPKLEEAYSKLINFFIFEGVNVIDEYVNYRISDPNTEIRVLEKCIQIFIAIDKRVRFKVLLQDFADLYGILHKYPEIEKYHNPFLAFSHILMRVGNRFRDRTVNIRGAEKKVKKLINDHLSSDGIENTIDQIDILSETFKDIVKEEGSEQGGAIAAEQKLRYRISIDFSSDPGFYGTLTEKIDEVIKKYENNWEKHIELFEKYLQEMRMRKQSSSSGSENQLLPYLDLLKSNFNIDINKVNNEKLTNLFVQIIQIFESISIPEFKNPLERNKILAGIDDLLIEASSFEISLYNQKTEISKELVDLYLKRNNN